MVVVCRKYFENPEKIQMSKAQSIGSGGHHWGDPTHFSKETQMIPEVVG